MDAAASKPGEPRIRPPERADDVDVDLLIDIVNPEYVGYDERGTNSGRPVALGALSGSYLGQGSTLLHESGAISKEQRDKRDPEYAWQRKHCAG